MPFVLVLLRLVDWFEDEDEHEPKNVYKPVDKNQSIFSLFEERIF